METKPILEDVKQALLRKEISREDVLSMLSSLGETDHTQSRLAKVLYYIGAIVVLLGLVILVGTNWGEFSSTMRVLATLGSAGVFYVSAVLLGQKNESGISLAFFIISLVLFPLGVGVLLHELDTSWTTPVLAMVISLSTALVAFVSLRLYKRLFIEGVLIASLTAFLWSIVAYVISQQDYPLWLDVAKPTFIVTGLSYLFLGYFRKEKTVLPQLLYIVGSGLIFITGLTLDGFWEVVYPFAVFGLIYSSVFVRSRALLTCGTLALIAFIIKISSEYFSDSLGWSLTLVISGLCIIFVAYGSLKLSQKFIKVIA